VARENRQKEKRSTKLVLEGEGGSQFHKPNPPQKANVPRVDQSLGQHRSRGGRYVLLDPGKNGLWVCSKTLIGERKNVR